MPSQEDDDWQTLGGIRLEKTYGPDDAGNPPYTRGIHNTMYRSRRWTMRQYAGFSSAVETIRHGRR